jgi:putative DNA primase/helicase
MNRKSPKQSDDLTPYERFIVALEQAGCDYNQATNKWRCPAHHDPNESLGVVEKEGKLLVRCYAGCDTNEILKMLGTSWAKLLAGTSNGARSGDLGDPVETFRYTDAKGHVVFRSVRYEPNGEDKTFRLHARVNGAWDTKLGGTRLVLYRLPEVIRGVKAGKTIHITEGERKADRLKKMRLVATTMPGGTGMGWRDEYNEPLRGADVVIIADNDEPGIKHALGVARRLEGIAATATVLMPPTEGHDVVNHLDAGGILEDLVPVVVADVPEPEPLQGTDEEEEPEPSHTVDPSVYFDPHDGFVSPMLGAEIRETYGVRVGLGSHLYCYEDGVYLDAGDKAQMVREAVRRSLGDRFRRRHADEVVAWLQSSRQDLPDTADPTFINVANGMLNWATGELLPHSPDFCSLVQIPVAWNPEATCPRIDSFLEEVLPSDAQDLAREILGYMLLTEAPLRRAFMLVGAGSNGKSKFLGMARSLAGETNCTAIPLQVFGESRFASADVYGRLANICGDLDAVALRRSDLFKILTGGGDTVSAERKFGSRFEFVPFVTLMFSANEVPPSHDQSEAIFDRWVVLPFDRRFDEDDGTADPFLLGRITTNEELEGLLVQAIHGLRRLMKRGHFRLPESVLKANADYRGHVDTVTAFIDEVVELAMDRSATRSKLYEAYRSWCMNNGRHAVSAQNFTQRFKQVFREEIARGVIEERVGRGVRRWQGIRVRT